MDKYKDLIIIAMICITAIVLMGQVVSCTKDAEIASKIIIPNG